MFKDYPVCHAGSLVGNWNGRVKVWEVSWSWLEKGATVAHWLAGLSFNQGVGGSIPTPVYVSLSYLTLNCSL